MSIYRQHITPLTQKRKYKSPDVYCIGPLTQYQCNWLGSDRQYKWAEMLAQEAVHLRKLRPLAAKNSPFVNALRVTGWLSIVGHIIQWFLWWARP